MRSKRLRQSSALAVIGFLIAMLACGAKGSTPTESFKSFFEAAKKRDAAAMKRMISKRMLAELEDEAKKEGKPLDDYLLGVNLPETLPEVRSEKIEGDTATLEIKGRTDTWRLTRFVKEDGEWKLDSE